MIDIYVKLNSISAGINDYITKDLVGHMHLKLQVSMSLSLMSRIDSAPLGLISEDGASTAGL